MPVLITAGSSSQAYRLQRILNEKEVIFSDENTLPQIPGNRTLVLPPYSSGSFAHETLKACLDHNIHAIYPLKWGEITELSHTRQLFSEYNIRLVIPSDTWLENNLNKPALAITNLAVLEEGILKAGTLPESHFLHPEETGIFSWATKEEEFEYSLYVV